MGRPLRILVAEDSSLVYRALKQMLETQGHQVVGHAPNGLIAVRLADKLQPDVVFMDVVMPEMGGLEALRTIRAAHKHIAVLMLTSTGATGHVVQDAHRLGAAEVLTKPARADEVMQALARLQIGNS